jgi:hypothetical protein
MVTIRYAVLLLPRNHISIYQDTTASLGSSDQLLHIRFALPKLRDSRGKVQGIKAPAAYQRSTALGGFLYLVQTVVLTHRQ